MPNLENLKKQAKQLVRWHREGNYSVAGKIRATLPRYRNSTDAELLSMTFTLSMAQEIIARESGFESWAALKSGVDHMPTTESLDTPNPSIVAVNPQIFVSNMRTACEFYTGVLGFAVVFLHGAPLFMAK